MYVVLKIAKKEFLNLALNHWFLFFSGIFLLIIMILVHMLSGQERMTLERLLHPMSLCMQIIMPIIGVMFGSVSVVGEIETGTMTYLISLPVKRYKIIIGKFLGLGGIMCLTSFFGFVIGGIVISNNIPDHEPELYFTFVFIFMILGLIFLSMSILLSSFFKSRSTAIGASFFVWMFFWAFWYILIEVIVLSPLKSEGIYAKPDWYQPLQILNPIKTYELKTSGILYNSCELPDYLIFLTLFLWIILPLLASYFTFQRRDI